MSRLRSRLERLESRHNQDDEMVLIGPLSEEWRAKITAITGQPFDDVKPAARPVWVRRSKMDMVMASLRVKLAALGT